MYKKRKPAATNQQAIKKEATSKVASTAKKTSSSIKLTCNIPDFSLLENRLISRYLEGGF